MSRRWNVSGYGADKGAQPGPGTWMSLVMLSVSMSSGGRLEGGTGGGLKHPGVSWEAFRGATGPGQGEETAGRGSDGGQAEESSGTPSEMQVQVGFLWGVM